MCAVAVLLIGATAFKGVDIISPTDPDTWCVQSHFCFVHNS